MPEFKYCKIKHLDRYEKNHLITWCKEEGFKILGNERDLQEINYIILNELSVRLKVSRPSNYYRMTVYTEVEDVQEFMNLVSLKAKQKNLHEKKSLSLFPI